MALYVDIEKKCGDFLLKVKFTAEKEVLGLLGASGCGKSMTLKCIAGIEKPDKGVIRLDDKVFFDSEHRINLPVQKRKVGYLFQDYALFPNMTVLQNIMCGAKDRKKAEEYTIRFLLEGKENLYPSQLSGGQKQRAAMARMLSVEPKILMLDEPFSALDNYLKMQLERELMKVMEEYGGTVLFVSHDRNEAYRMTERIAVMEDGQILDVQPKEELFKSPASLAATLLTGCKNVSELETASDGGLVAKDWGIRLSAKAEPGKYKYAAFRAHYFQVVPEMEETNVLECRILRVIEDTFSTVILFCSRNRTGESPREVLTYELPKEKWQEWKNREKLYLKMPAEQIILLEK